MVVFRKVSPTLHCDLPKAQRGENCLNIMAHLKKKAAITQYQTRYKIILI